MAEIAALQNVLHSGRIAGPWSLTDVVARAVIAHQVLRLVAILPVVGVA